MFLINLVRFLKLICMFFPAMKLLKFQSQRTCNENYRYISENRPKRYRYIVTFQILHKALPLLVTNVTPVTCNVLLPISEYTNTDSC